MVVELGRVVDDLVKVRLPDGRQDHVHNYEVDAGQA